MRNNNERIIDGHSLIASVPFMQLTEEDQAIFRRRTRGKCYHPTDWEGGAVRFNWIKRWYSLGPPAARDYEINVEAADGVNITGTLVLYAFVRDQTYQHEVTCDLIERGNWEVHIYEDLTD